MIYSLADGEGKIIGRLEDEGDGANVGVGDGISDGEGEIEAEGLIIGLGDI